jgi:hypothetical protein
MMTCPGVGPAVLPAGLGSVSGVCGAAVRCCFRRGCETVKDITSLIQVSDDYVRGVIHAFNE